MLRPHLAGCSHPPRATLIYVEVEVDRAAIAGGYARVTTDQQSNFDSNLSRPTCDPLPRLSAFWLNMFNSRWLNPVEMTAGNFRSPFSFDHHPRRTFSQCPRHRALWVTNLTLAEMSPSLRRLSCRLSRNTKLFPQRITIALWSSVLMAQEISSIQTYVTSHLLA